MTKGLTPRQLLVIFGLASFTVSFAGLVVWESLQISQMCGPPYGSGPAHCDLTPGLVAGFDAVIATAISLVAVSLLYAALRRFGSKEAQLKLNAPEVGDGQIVSAPSSS